MKKSFLFSIVVFVALSCEDNITTQNNKIVSDVTENTTLTSNEVYLLEDGVKVSKGATLTIEPGTVLLNKKGQVTGPEEFVIEKGGKVIAKGVPQLHF